MKLFRNILKGSTLATALFIYQACYGIPQGPLYEYGMAPMSFSIISASDGQPISGIKIGVKSDGGMQEIGVTGDDGRCKVDIPYFRNALGPYLSFYAPDGRFADKDTMLADLREREIVIKMTAKE